MKKSGNFFAAKSLEHQQRIEYYHTFRLFHLKSDDEKDTPFNVIPNDVEYDGVDAIMWQNRMIAFLASDGTTKDFNKLFKRTDYGKVFEMYVLRTAASLKG